MSAWGAAGMIIGLFLVPVLSYSIASTMFSQLVFRNARDDFGKVDGALSFLLVLGAASWAGSMGWGDAPSVSVATFFLVLVGASIGLALISGSIATLVSWLRKRK
jgi:hypothetical protein